MKSYLYKNCILLFIQAIFLYLLLNVDNEYVIYINFLFYISIIIYFYFKRDKDEISAGKLVENLRSGSKFWKQVVFTILGLIVAFILMNIIGILFPSFDKGDITLRANGKLQMFIFILSTIIFPPIAEELFYRKNLIVTKCNSLLILTVLFSSFLFGLEHAITLWGAMLWSIIGIAFSISYIITKNIYVNITSHFILNFGANGIPLIIRFFNHS